MILNVDRSAPEHEVHPTGSVGGGGQRGTGHGGRPKKGLSGRVQNPKAVSLPSDWLGACRGVGGGGGWEGG